MEYYKSKESEKRNEIKQIKDRVRKENEALIKKEVSESLDFIAPKAGRTAGEKMSAFFTEDWVSNNEKVRMERKARERHIFSFLVIICVVVLLLLIFI